tara:strand:- start:1717 stop:2007 length:291 start_codon:yes stop_codon:yes gene_type:complete
MDNDFPTVMANGPVGFLQQYSRGINKYSQGGTDIPDFTTQSSYANEDGGPLIAIDRAAPGYTPTPAELQRNRGTLLDPIKIKEELNKIRLQNNIPR